MSLLELSKTRITLAPLSAKNIDETAPDLPLDISSTIISLRVDIYM